MGVKSQVKGNLLTSSLFTKNNIYNKSNVFPLILIYLVLLSVTQIHLALVDVLLGLLLIIVQLW